MHRCLAKTHEGPMRSPGGAGKEAESAGGTGNREGAGGQGPGRGRREGEDGARRASKMQTWRMISGGCRGFARAHVPRTRA
eukprot:6013138-Pyramimonas_sp.AAC.1